MDKVQLYDQLIGVVDAAPGIENLFEEGEPCAELYNRVYDAR